MFSKKIVRNVLALRGKQVNSSYVQFTNINEFSTRRTQRYPRPLKTKKYGIDVLKDSLWNKSLAFDLSERDRLGIRGLIPPAVRTIESQVERLLGHLRSQPDDVAKNLYLQDLHNRNETLYHRLLVDNVSFWLLPA